MKYWKPSMKFMVLFSLFFSILLPSTSLTSVSDGLLSSSDSNQFITTYNSSTPIEIIGNEDFASSGFPGNGTFSNPYRISNLNITSDNTSIFIVNVDVHFVIENCYLRNNGTDFPEGIFFSEVANGVVKSNIITQFSTGILIRHSNSLTLVNNTVNLNTCNSYFLNSRNCTIANNTFSNDIFGLKIINSFTFSVSNNTFSNSDLFVEGGSLDNWFHNIDENTVNGKPLGYFWNATGLIVVGQNYGQLVFANSTNITIQGGAFYNSSNPIYFGFSSNCTIGAVHIENTTYGIGLFQSHEIILENNNILNCDSNGIQAFVSSFCKLTNNIIRNCSIGIYSLESIALTLDSNQISNSGYSIRILKGGSLGILNNTILENSVGINILNAQNASVRDNLVEHNFDGIFLDHCQNFQVFNNTLAWNTNNARDSKWLNSWDNGMGIGNIWSDYRAPGIYNIPGSAGSVDNYPSLLLEFDPPTINTPEDIEYEIGENDNTILWNASDVAPSNYELYNNSVLVQDSYWDGGIIEVDVDGLPLGQYNLTIVVYDLSGNNVKDTVLVEVINPVIEDIDITPLIIILFCLAAVGIGVLIANEILTKRGK